MYPNCCCSCSFEPEIIKIGQLSHKMCSNNIVNFQESTTILNACIKKRPGNLLNAPRTCHETKQSVVTAFLINISLLTAVYDDIYSSINEVRDSNWHFIVISVV